MGRNDTRKSCVKCQKMVKSSEKVLMCGLWCRKAFHNDCVGLTNNETRVVTCSNERIKFHCGTCENRLCMELIGEQKTHETNKSQTCVNDCLLELVEKILKLTNELSNDNSVINRKLDAVISTNIRLEEYMLKSSKCLEKRGEEIIDNSVECVERLSAKQTTEISEENNDTNSDSPSVNSASLSQQTDNSFSIHIASGIPIELSHNQDPLVAEESGSNCLQEMEMNDYHSLTQDLPSTNKEECIPSEEFLVHSVCSIVKKEYEGGEEKAEIEIKKECLQEMEMNDYHSLTQDLPSTNTEECIPSEEFLVHSVCSIVKKEYEGGEEKAEIEIKKEECSYSEDPLECGSSSIEKTEDDAAGEPGRDDTFEELKHEVEPESSDNEPESNTLDIGLDDHNNKDDRSHLVTKDSWKAGKGRRIQRTTKQEVSCGNNKTLKQKTTLKQHSQVYSGQHSSSSNVWNKTLSQKCNLLKHLLLHSAERPFSCWICNKTFTRKRDLQVHSRLHSGERPFRCSVCNKTFTRKSHLQEHSWLYSGERPFSCNVCNKTFSQKSTLQVHLRVHSGERPFSCNVCNKTFSQKSTLQGHLRVHSGERPFSCNVCNKSFSQKSTLQGHLRVHSGKRPFSCSVCNKTFVHRRSMKNHLGLHTEKVH